MQKRINLIILGVAISIGLGLGTNAVVNTPNKAPNKAQTQVIQSVPAKKVANIASNTTYEDANALDVALHPTKYLNKHIKIKAKFDKFATLGLDYKPAYRSSEKYISFLIMRDDIINHTVPLSEMKIFLKREVAEKYIDLNVGDTIEFSGVVFSDALGDAWVDVDKFTVLTTSKPKENSTKK